MIKLCFSEFLVNACYGGYVGIDCFGLKIQIIKELFGRHPEEKCLPSSDGSDCSVPDTYYTEKCNGKPKCEHLGVGWRLLNTTRCREVYTNYVHLVYNCVRDTGEWLDQLVF